MRTKKTIFLSLILCSCSIFSGMLDKKQPHVVAQPPVFTPLRVETPNQMSKQAIVHAVSAVMTVGLTYYLAKNKTTAHKVVYYMWGASGLTFGALTAMESVKDAKNKGPISLVPVFSFPLVFVAADYARPEQARTTKLVVELVKKLVEHAKADTGKK